MEPSTEPSYLFTLASGQIHKLDLNNHYSSFRLILCKKVARLFVFRQKSTFDLRLLRWFYFIMEKQVIERIIVTVLSLSTTCDHFILCWSFQAVFLPVGADQVSLCSLRRFQPRWRSAGLGGLGRSWVEWTLMDHHTAPLTSRSSVSDSSSTQMWTSLKIRLCPVCFGDPIQ